MKISKYTCFDILSYNYIFKNYTRFKYLDHYIIFELSVDNDINSNIQLIFYG